MSPRFFSTGHFRSDGVTARGGGWRLSDEVRVPYHLPLPQRYRRQDRNYALGSEGRFYSKMDFSHRPKQYRVLETSITIRQIGDSAFDLAFDVDGPATSLTIELCFRSGGSLPAWCPPAGTATSSSSRARVLTPSARTRSPSVPATAAGSAADRHGSGEKYTYLGGSLVPAGQRVYITGEVPFQYTLRLR